MNMPGEERLLAWIEDLRLERDRSIVPNLDLCMTGRHRGRPSGLVLRVQLRVQNAHHATVLRRRRAGAPTATRQPATRQTKILRITTPPFSVETPLRGTSEAHGLQRVRRANVKLVQDVREIDGSYPLSAQGPPLQRDGRVAARPLCPLGTSLSRMPPNKSARGRGDELGFSWQRRRRPRCLSRQ